MIVIPMGAILVLIWVRFSKTPWKEIGYANPTNWTFTIIGGIFFGIALKFLMKAVVMPLFDADPINKSYHFLAGNRAMLPAAVWAMIVAGFGEETVFRGYMFERLDKLLGQGFIAKPIIVIITSVLFGLAHYNSQGVTGVEQATITGLVWGSIFATSGKIWFVMLAHAAFDLTALAMIYYNLETDVAHLFFK